MLKKIIKKFIPNFLLSFYHKTLAVVANIWYRFPSRQMVVIGVTGTKGKSSAVMMITRILEEAGHKVGSSNTIFFKIDEKEWGNNLKQGMPGRFYLQKLLRQMVKAKCTHAVIEVTSEGIAQHRQWGIAFDVLVFTNLSPEHIESHGSFSAYREAKLSIFKNLHLSARKIINGREVKKIIVANRQDEEAGRFLDNPADVKWAVWGLCSQARAQTGEENLCADEIRDTDAGVALTIEGYYIKLNIPGEFMAGNAMLAIAAARSLGISFSVCEKALEAIPFIPGRLEDVSVGQNFRALVDYAHEPKSMQASLRVGRRLAKDKKLIVVFGVTGGGRDTAKRPVMGKIASEYADYIILTTDDPYDDDPVQLVEGIAPGIDANKFMENQNWWRVIDRRQAIAKAIALARKDDVVMVLGKGSESKMAIAAGKLIDWSDVEVVKEFLRVKTNLTPPLSSARRGSLGNHD